MARRDYRRDRRNILGRNAAKLLLDPYLDELLLASRDGVAHFGKESAELMLPYRKRTKANMLNDAIVHYAKVRLAGIEGVVIDETFDGTFFIVGDVLALRIKKLSRTDCTANIRTRRQRDVDGQVLEFPGISSPTIVTFGYTLNVLWTEIVDAKVFCQVNDHREWTIPLVASEASPIFPITDDQFDEGPRVRSRRRRAEDGGPA